MRIDSHQHYWHYDPNEYGWISDEMPLLKRNVLPSDIQSTLEAHSMDGVIAVQARQSLAENTFLLGLSEQYDWIKGVIGWIDLRSDDLVDQLMAVQHPKLKGYRHLVQDEPNPSLYFADQAFNRGVKTVLDHGYVYEVLFHEKDLKAATEFCERHDQAPLVIDHLGKPNIAMGNPSKWRQKIQKLAALPHVYCKLSGLITEAACDWKATDIQPFIEIALELFTPERLMFGSDWPVCQLAGSYHDVYGLIESQIKALSEHEQALVMGNVACKIYQLID